MGFTIDLVWQDEQQPVQVKARSVFGVRRVRELLQWDNAEHIAKANVRSISYFSRWEMDKRRKHPFQI